MVRDLYKRFLIAGTRYPQGLDHVREKVKIAFFENRVVNSDLEFKKAINKGRYWVKEIEAISQMHKYRTMRKRYS